MASGSRYPRLLCPIGNQNRGGAADLRGKTMKVIWNMLNLCCPLENQPWGTRSSPGVSGKDVTEVAQKEESAGLTWTLQPSQSPQPHGPSQVCCQETSQVAKKQGQTPPPGSVPARVPNGSALFPSTVSTIVFEPPTFPPFFPQTVKRTNLGYTRHLGGQPGKAAYGCQTITFPGVITVRRLRRRRASSLSGARDNLGTKEVCNTL